jgi:hypothetical protein
MDTKILMNLVEEITAEAENLSDKRKAKKSATKILELNKNFRKELQK